MDIWGCALITAGEVVSEHLLDRKWPAVYLIKFSALQICKLEMHKRVNMSS